MRDCLAACHQVLNYANTCLTKVGLWYHDPFVIVATATAFNDRTAIDLQLFLTKRIVMMIIDIPRKLQSFNESFYHRVSYHACPNIFLLKY